MVPAGVSVVTTTWNERENIEKLVLMTEDALPQVQHETIVVDDDSPDGTIQIAKRVADVAVTKPREGQTKGLLYGMRLAKYPTIITIDADLENDPTHIPNLIQQTAKFDIVVASGTTQLKLQSLTTSAPTAPPSPFPNMAIPPAVANPPPNRPPQPHQPPSTRRHAQTSSHRMLEG
jgi:glycosyltransferase involved in cell wall biosynthesis